MQGRGAQVGLVGVPTTRLRTLLRAVFREETPCPLSPGGLAALGLQDWSETVLGALRQQPRSAVQAVLVCVIAERDAVEVDD